MHHSRKLFTLGIVFRIEHLRTAVAAVGKIPAALAGDERRTLAHEAGGVIAVGLARQQHRVQLAQMGGDPFQMVHMASSFTVPAPCP